MVSAIAVGNFAQANGDRTSLRGEQQARHDGISAQAALEIAQQREAAEAAASAAKLVFYEKLEQIRIRETKRLALRAQAAADMTALQDVELELAKVQRQLQDLEAASQVPSILREMQDTSHTRTVAEYSAMAKQLLEIQTQLDTARAQLRDKQSSVEDQRKAAAEISAKGAALESELKAANAELQELTQKSQKAEREFGAIRERLNNQQASLTSAETELRDARQQLKRKREKLQEAQDQIAQSKAQIDSMKHHQIGIEQEQQKVAKPTPETELISAEAVCRYFDENHCSVSLVCAWDETVGGCRSQPEFSRYAATHEEWAKHIISVYAPGMQYPYAQLLLGEVVKQRVQKGGPINFVESLAAAAHVSINVLASYIIGDAFSKR